MDTSRTVGVDSALGSTPYFNGALGAATLVAAAVTGRPRVLYSMVITNPHTTIVYVQFFNAASAAAVTLGTTPPAQSFAVPPTNGTLQLSFADVGIRFDAGIVIASTTTPTGAILPTTLTVLNISYA